MKCEDFRYRISLKADGRLPEALQGDLASHLESCPSCRDFESSLTRWKSRLPAGGAGDPGEAFTHRVLEEARRPRPSGGGGWKPWALAAALLIAALAPIVLVVRSHRISSSVGTSPGARDKIWMLFAQVAYGRLGSEKDDIAGLREELAASGLGTPLPHDCQPAAGLLDRLIRTAQTGIPTPTSLEELRQDIRSSGVIEDWRPQDLATNTPPHSPRPTDSNRPFASARRFLYAGDTEASLATFHSVVSSDADSRNDALFWIAFLESRRGRGAEALGAYCSLLAFDSDWLDPASIGDAQRLTLALADRSESGRARVPLWKTPDPKAGSRWDSVEIALDDTWCSLQSRRPKPSRKNAAVELEIRGVTYKVATLAELRAQSTEAAQFLERRLPKVYKFLEEGQLDSP